MNIFMAEAVKEAKEGIQKGHGGPFGSVIVKDGIIIGRGHNCVLKDTDPTLHGEVMAIKDACKTIGSIDLSDTELYTTAEPCPMCLGAILWANIGKIYYGCNRTDTEKIGFRDNIFYDMMENPMLQISELERASCLELFSSYQNIKDKIIY